MYTYFNLLWGISQGDFVDRGYNSLEVFTILLLLKARYVSFRFFFQISYAIDCAALFLVLSGCPYAADHASFLSSFDIIALLLVLFTL